jgi:cell division transport system permease protein
MKKLNLTLKRIRRSPYQSISALLMTTVTFFVVTIFALVVLGAHQMLAFFESRPQVTAFFKDDTTSAQVDSLRTQIENSTTVESTKYISKEDALALYREQNQENPLLLEMVTADILPASLEVSAKNVADLETIASVMQGNAAVEEVVFQKDVIDTLKKWVTGVRLGGGLLSGLLLLTSLTTIVVILGLKFTSKKSEINTMSLLGATSWYIRAPFIFEGILYGIAGAILGWGLTYLSLLYLSPNLVEFLGEIPLVPVPLWVMGAILGGEVVLGLILGGVSSLIATNRYGK